uniref:Uncharacterized protein n=1 Tax=Hyaloperonospora arabidopsidis (strain Emoy2) TaxID=559515 RepID=M4BQY9_HYAAE
MLQLAKRYCALRSRVSTRSELAYCRTRETTETVGFSTPTGRFCYRRSPGHSTEAHGPADARVKDDAAVGSTPT